MFFNKFWLYGLGIPFFYKNEILFPVATNFQPRSFVRDFVLQKSNIRIGQMMKF